MWIALALAAVLLRRRAPSLFLTVAVAVFAADGAATALKQLFDRPRPYVRDPEPEPLTTTALQVGFPSGHAATSFAGATVLALALPRAALPLFALAALVAASRIYVGVHYPGDVLVGALLGVAVGALVWAAVVRRRRRPDQNP